LVPERKADEELLAPPMLLCPECHHVMFTGGFTEDARTGRYLEVKHRENAPCRNSGKEWRLPYKGMSVEVFK
jgi:hypothetical protein